MQNSTLTKKWSDINGHAAVALDTGKKVGTIEDFYFDPPTSSVRGFIIKMGLINRRILLSSSIKAIGADAITFSNEDDLVKENDEQLKGIPLGRGLLSYRVLSEGGNVIGTIGNIIMDVTAPATLYIASFEMAGGLRERLTGRFPTFSASQVTRYGHDVLVIPDDVAQSLK